MEVTSTSQNCEEDEQTQSPAQPGEPSVDHDGNGLVSHELEADDRDRGVLSAPVVTIEAGATSS